MGYIWPTVHAAQVCDVYPCDISSHLVVASHLNNESKHALSGFWGFQISGYRAPDLLGFGGIGVDDDARDI